MLLSDPIQGHPAFCSTTDSITSSSAVPGLFLQPWAVPGAGRKGPSTSRELLYALTLLSSSTLPLTPQMLFMTLIMYLACKRPDKENTPRYQILKAEWAPTVGDRPWAHSSVSGSGESAAKLWQSKVSDKAGAEIMMFTGTTPAEGESGIF